MRIVNANEIEELRWGSPGGRFEGFGKELSEALGRDRDSTDLMLRHPFDVELSRFPPGSIPFPYHSHSAQWEFYHVLSGSGRVRHADGEDAIGPGDTFLFKPGEPHQLFAGDDELVLLTIADNPIGETCHYPDSEKWIVRSPERRLIRSAPLDYWDGEE